MCVPLLVVYEIIVFEQLNESYIIFHQHLYLRHLIDLQAYIYITNQA